MTKPWILHADSEAHFFEAALEDITLAVQETLKTRSDFRLGLAGGSTPKKLYEMLASAKLPWQKIKVILLDERYVPSDDAESNLGMIRRALLSRAAIPPENVYSFDTSLPRESAAEDMSRKLSELKPNGRPLFDLLILGAGADGHVASLFEGDTALECLDFACTAYANGYPTPERLTLGLSALRSSDRALLLLKGAEKQSVLDALEGAAQPPLTALKAISQNATTKVLVYF